MAKRRASVACTRECLRAPDGDNLELLHVDAPVDAPRVLLLHGLEGSWRSHYVDGILAAARERGWGATFMHFRGCGSAPNVAQRFYHSGETSDLDHVFQVVSTRWPGSSWLLTGVSLGGNVLLKWLGERADGADPRVRAAAVVSVPFDLEAGARAISRGFARVYDRAFLRSLRAKALLKLGRYPDLFDRERLRRARSVYDFDETVTAPVHGFASAHDYYSRSSALGYLSAIRVPTLLLSAFNDPFLPAEVLSKVGAIAAGNPNLKAEFHRSGGHVGFVEGSVPWRPRYYAERRVYEFFDGVMERQGATGYD